MKAEAFRQFICRACGYIYDEALGDPDGGLAAGTRYEDIPDDWMCPTCGVGKSDFEPYIVADIPAVAKSAALPLQRGAGEPVIIVGGGIAAWSVARALRAQDADLPITMISACHADVYSKPMLSVACAQGKSPQALVSTTGTDCAAQLGVRLIPDTWMVGLDTARRKIRTTRGTLPYRDLIIATGAAPAPLPLDDASQKCVWRINHLHEYAAFRQRLTTKGGEPCDIVIIGAGLVGCELADDLAAQGHRCTLLEAAPQPLMGLAAPANATELINAYAKAGIRIQTDTLVTSVQRGGTGYMVHCSYGLISADLVLAATGLRTDGRVAHSAGLAFDNGYAVDAVNMRTSDDHVFALGDCASFTGRAYRFIEPIRRQAEVIAARICGAASAGFDVRPIPVRLKSRTMPLTFQMAA